MTAAAARAARLAAAAGLVALAGVAGLAGCGSSHRPGGPIGNHAATSCRERLLGEQGAEAVNVAAADGVVAWQGYNFGALSVQPVDGDEARVLVTHDTEHLTEDLLLHAGFAYWTSKAERALFRVALAGGTPERLVDTGEHGPTHLARVGDTIYVRTFDKEVFTWSPFAGAKSVVTSQAEPALAGRDAQLYLGREYDIAATLDLSRDAPHQVASTQGRVGDVAITASMLYWLESDNMGGDNLMRQGRSGGDPERLVVPPGMLYALAATDQGVFFAAGEVVLWADDRAPEPVEVTRFAPDDSPTDIDAFGTSVFVGTSGGKAYQRCFVPPVPASSPALAPALSPALSPAPAPIGT